MRYKESKEQSAELVRSVLALMGQHDAAFNPVSYAVWYEFAAGMNVRLVKAIEAALQVEPRLGDATLNRLYQTHVVDADPEVIQRISSELQYMMAGMAESALRTGDRAGLFSEQLLGLTEALNTNDPSAMTPFVTQALAGTLQMRSSAQELEQQIIVNRLEIERLNVDLLRARDEVLLDPLTRILNRKGFDQQLALMLAEPLALNRQHYMIMLDIDHFKHVNDTHGHVIGDRVIEALGKVLSYCSSDKTHSVARYGGEEFAILLPNSTLNFCLKLADTVLQQTKAMKIRDRRTQQVVLTVSLSAGVAAMLPGDEVSDLIERADAALYQSKKRGRDCVTAA